MKSARLDKPEPGLLELLARVDETDLNDEDAFIRGGKLKDMYVGCTWYVNRDVVTN